MRLGRLVAVLQTAPPTAARCSTSSAASTRAPATLGAMTGPAHLAVVGAGPAGLTAAHRLSQAASPSRCSSGRRWPAVARTASTTAPGHWVDTGAGWLASFYPDTLALLDELGPARPADADAAARWRRPAARRADRADAELGPPHRRDRAARTRRQAALLRLHGPPASSASAATCDVDLDHDGERAVDELQRMGARGARPRRAAELRRAVLRPPRGDVGGARALVAALPRDGDVLPRRRWHGRAVATARRHARRCAPASTSRTSRRGTTHVEIRHGGGDGALRRRRRRRTGTGRRNDGRRRAPSGLARRRRVRPPRAPLRRPPRPARRPQRHPRVPQRPRRHRRARRWRARGVGTGARRLGVGARLCAGGGERPAARRAGRRGHAAAVGGGDGRSTGGCSTSTTPSRPADPLAPRRAGRRTPATSPGCGRSRKRPPLVFAGDWLVQPCVEGAVRSGNVAAACFIGTRGQKERQQP